MEIKSIIQDIKTVIKKEGKDELRYGLPDEKTLVVEVIDNAYGDLEIAVERLDEFGNTEECATDDYDCDDKVLWSMIENAIMR